MTDPRKIKRLIDWLVKQRAQHLDMVTDAGDASLWCKEEADLISEHIRTVEALATRPKAHEVTPRPAWDDETCLRFAEAYDREDAAQRGEPSPHADKGEGYAEWVADRIACARAGLAALTPAPQAEGQGHRSFPDAADGRPMPPMGDDLMTAGLSGEDARFVALQLAQNGLMLVLAAPTAQEAEPVAWRCKDYGDGWIVYGHKPQADLYQASTGCLMQPLYAHPHHGGQP